MAERDLPPVLIIAGPSGSGKSALALDLAAEMDGVIVNGDSMQLYRELRILTARPTPEDEARVPHRLYGILGAAEASSVARWLDRALDEIAACRAAGRVAIVVGGTGFYLETLMRGLSPLPEIPEDLRRQARALFDELGEAGFRRHLAAIDAESAVRPLDPQRLVRAYEVAAATGRSLPDWQRLAPPAPPLPGPIVSLALMPPRPRLYPALDHRFDAMIAAGAVEEVRALLALGLDAGLPAMKAVGVGEVAAFVRGETTLALAAAAAKRATRRYAKRQLTWLRHRMAGAIVWNEQYSERDRADMCTFIRRSLLTCGG